MGSQRRANRGVGAVAEEPFLSIKTVVSHLRDIVTKLGVTARLEVAR